MPGVPEFPLSYVHCVKYNPNELDRAPHSAYEWREVPAVMYRLAANPLLGLDESFEVRVNGVGVGWGDSKEDAIGEAKYNLMNSSRKSAPVN
jgi:hypothetical protein